MSIVVAMTGRNCAVVASDTQIVDVHGNAHDGFNNKCFVAGPLLIGQAGLLEIAGTSVVVLVRKMEFTAFENIDAAAAGIAEELKANFFPLAPALRPTDRLDLIIVGPKKLDAIPPLSIRAIEFRPEGDGTAEVRATIKTFTSYCTIGDESACKAVSSIVDKQKYENSDTARMEIIARAAIVAGIRKAGQHPDFENIPSCGGKPFARARTY